MTIQIRAVVNKRAALLAGRDLPDQVDIAVTPDDFGPDLWPELIAQLDTARTPPVLGSWITVAEPTADAVKAAVTAYIQNKRRIALAPLIALRKAVAETRAAVAAPPVPDECHVPRSVTGVCLFSRYAGFTRYLPYGTEGPFRESQTDLTDAERAEVAALIAEAKALRQTSDAELATLNAAALEAALPALRQAYATRQQELTAKRAADDAAVTATNAERLRTGIWEIDTPSYNKRRYAPWWCARVTGQDNGRLHYEFGLSTGRYGSSGILQLEGVSPGTLIAYGQKDTRGNGGSYTLAIMESDGAMQEVTRTEAIKHLQAKDRDTAT